jgi:hypothetical protein
VDDKVGANEKLSSEVRQRISRELPLFIRDIDPKTAPKRVELHTGESLADAPRMTAIKCHSVARTKSARLGIFQNSA